MSTPTVTLHTLVDSAGTARELRQLGDEGVAVVSARPTTRTDKDRALVEDLLRCVGVSPDVSGTSTQKHWHDHVLWWWHGHGIRELVTIDIQLLGSAQLQLLIDVATISGCDLTLVATGPLDEQQTTLLDQWPVRHAPDHELHDRLDRTHHPTTHAPADTAPIRVPTCDWPAFAAETDRLLPADQAATVRGWMRNAATDLARTLEGRTTDEDTVGAWLRQQAVDADHVDQLVATIRAAQTWLFLHGWHLQVDLTGLLARLTDPPTAPLHHNGTWARLRAYRQPERHVTCLLAAHGLAFDQIRALTVADVTADATTIRHDSRDLSVPAAARPALAALLLGHAQHAASPDTPLLTQQDRQPASDTTLAKHISEAVTDVGVAVVSGRTTRRSIEVGNWMRRHGLNLTRIGDDDA